MPSYPTRAHIFIHFHHTPVYLIPLHFIGSHYINGNFRILKWRYCTIWGHILLGYIPIKSLGFHHVFSALLAELSRLSVPRKAMIMRSDSMVTHTSVKNVGCTMLYIYIYSPSLSLYSLSPLYIHTLSLYIYYIHIIYIYIYIYYTSELAQLQNFYGLVVSVVSKVDWLYIFSG